jgi:hypothetical protein
VEVHAEGAEHLGEGGFEASSILGRHIALSSSQDFDRLVRMAIRVTVYR